MASGCNEEEVPIGDNTKPKDEFSEDDMTDFMDNSSGLVDSIQTAETDGIPVKRFKTENNGDEDNDTLIRDSRQLLAIFPEEIWMLTFDQITDSDDLETLCNSSLYFRHLLSPIISLFLFPKVWKILARQYDENHYVDHSFNEENIYDPYNCWERRFYRYFPDSGHRTTCDQCGRSRSTMWYSGILNLRLTCRTWLNAIDHYYQNDQRHYLMAEEKEEDTLPDNIWTAEDFDENNSDRQYIQRFINHFEKSHGSSAETDRSPFLGGAIVLRYFHREDDRNLERYANAVLNVLSKYGEHIWYCEMTTYHTFRTRVTFYTVIRQWLELMPNLKVLRVTHIYNLMEDDYPDVGRQVDRQNVELNWQPALTLPKLEFLSTKDVPNLIFNRLLKACGDTLSWLEVDVRPIDDDYEYGVIPLPNLKQLSMNYHSEFDFIKLVALRERWPLTKLYLKCSDDYFVEWIRVFNLLQDKWAETLEHLELYLPKTDYGMRELEIMRDCMHWRLNFPKVKRLKLVMANVSVLDFILPMRECLERLEIMVHFDYDRCKENPMVKVLEKHQSVHFFGYFKRFLESNIWIEFPKLERLDFTESFDPGTGREWEKDDDDAFEWSSCSLTRNDWRKSVKSKKMANRDCDA